jgi:hypothetical protein
MPESDFYTPILDEDKRTNILSTISSPVWSGGTATLTAMYTSSVQSASSGHYYYDVYDKAENDSTREVQFAIAYGHINGSGSFSTSVGNNPTKAIYRQFRNVCLRNPHSDSRFNFNADGAGETYYAYDIFAINVNRARYREKLDPGNWELRLKKYSSVSSRYETLKLIDDSGATADSSIKGSQRVFNVISGSVENGTYSEHISAVSESNATAAHGSLGYFYPELGIIVLNAYALNQGPLGVTLTRTSDKNDDTAAELVGAVTSSQYFQARREEQIKSSHYFCRVRSDNYNYSQNPTYFTGSNAELTNPTFVQDPKAYITTVGLYNDNNELLAVAKLSQPLLKSRDREAVIKVRLDF